MDVTPSATSRLTTGLVDTQKDPQRQDLAREFETVLLSKFVDEMLKTVETGTFGNQKQADIWRSFLSDAVASQIAQSGGLGLAPQVNEALDAYHRAMHAK